MATKFTLDDIRAAAEKKYGSTDITLDDGTELVLLNAMRLPKDRRTKLLASQDLLNEEGADQAAIMADALRLVAEDPRQAEKLLATVGDDLALLAQVFDAYVGETELGEASASQA